MLAVSLTVALVAPVAAQDAQPSPSPDAAGIEAVLAAALDEGLAAGLTSPEAISEAGRELLEADRERLAASTPACPRPSTSCEAESRGRRWPPGIDDVLAGLDRGVARPVGRLSPEASPAKPRDGPAGPSSPQSGRACPTRSRLRPGRLLSQRGRPGDRRRSRTSSGAQSSTRARRAGPRPVRAG